MKSLLLPLIIAVFTFYGCQQTVEADSMAVKETEKDPIKLKEEFQNLEDSLAMAYNTKDLGIFKRFYAEDAITYGEGREQLFGQKEMVNHFIKNVVEDTSDLNFNYMTIDIFTDGKLAVETGKWTEENDKGSEIDHGFYMVLYEKQNGRWKSIRDIWNSSTRTDPMPDVYAGEEE